MTWFQVNNWRIKLNLKLTVHILGQSDLHDAGDLLDLALPREKRVSRVKLGQDAAQAPHVYGHAVRVAQDHLRRAVETALDVRVHCRRNHRNTKLNI